MLSIFLILGQHHWLPIITLIVFLYKNGYAFLSMGTEAVPSELLGVGENRKRLSECLAIML